MRLARLEERHLDGIRMLWNEEWGSEYPLRHRLLQQNIGEDIHLLPEGSWVAEDEAKARVLGFVVAKKAGAEAERYGIAADTGWIHMLLVASKVRGCGWGQALLDNAEMALREAGVRQIVLGSDLHRRMFPGIPDGWVESKRWFEKRGYVPGDKTCDLLHAYSEPVDGGFPPVLDAVFRVAGPDDREALAAFMARCFPGGWEYQLADYWQHGGIGREFVLLLKQEEIIGFCRMNDASAPLLAQNIYWSPLFAEELGGVGPLGIDCAYRGRQYGLAIVQAAIACLLGRGIRTIVIDTTPYIDFYGKLGYREWKWYCRYDKPI